MAGAKYPVNAEIVHVKRRLKCAVADSALGPQRGYLIRLVPHSSSAGKMTVALSMNKNL